MQEEFPSAHDSQSNGDIENAIGNFQGVMRAMKLGLERQFDVEVLHTHTPMSWLAEFAAWTQSTRSRGSSGETPYERVGGVASSC